MDANRVCGGELLAAHAISAGNALALVARKSVGSSLVGPTLVRGGLPSAARAGSSGSDVACTEPRMIGSKLVNATQIEVAVRPDRGG